MSAWYLKKKLGELCRVTIYEASDRLGGKVLTRKFDSAPATYEAGVAEIYDYSMTGPDPLREMIQHFGLQTIPMDAEQVQLDGELLNDVPGMRRKYGAKTADAIEAFRKRCSEMVTPIQYYEGVGSHDNDHPWAFLTAEEVLDKEVSAPTAKRLFKVMSRSVIAPEAHNTNGLNALKNFVMDIEGYIGLYSIQNGNEQLIEGLRSEVDAHQLLHELARPGARDGHAAERSGHRAHPHVPRPLRRPDPAQALFITEDAQPKVDAATNPARFRSHVSLHEPAIDQLVILAIGHGEQVFRCVSGLVLGRDRHAHQWAPVHGPGK